MPRANRHYLPGHIWHVTHGCHQRKFLLKFARDRRRYLHWVFEARMVTSNHIHLLVKDTGPNVIAESMQLIAGRTRGSWFKSSTSTEKNSVSVVPKVSIVPTSTIMNTLVTATPAVQSLRSTPRGAVQGSRVQEFNVNGKKLGFSGSKSFNRSNGHDHEHVGHGYSGRSVVEQGLENGLLMRDDRWSESIAVGSRSFVEKVKSELGLKAAHRDVIEADGSYALRELPEAYGLRFTGENEVLRSQNTFFWNEIVDEATI